MKTVEPKKLKTEIKNWWAANPMTYGLVHGKAEYEAKQGGRLQVELGSREFFEIADQTFYAWNPKLHTQAGRFSKIFDYPRFHGKNVLEIGCGMGCMAMNWAEQGASVTAVDLNPVAVAQTKRRFELYGLNGNIVERDAEHLLFPDAHFDYVYSWGVLHHSPHLQASLDEIFRVLKPGGDLGIMLYNRHSLLYRYTIEFLQGYLHMENSFLNELELASRYGDGDQEEGNPHTWPVTKKEIKVLFQKFQNLSVETLGSDLASVVDLAFPRFGSWLFPRACLQALARRFGWSLWITARKT